jgi:hypothetical protein
MPARGNSQKLDSFDHSSVQPLDAPAKPEFLQIIDIK